jgi:hypothetical protein
VVAQTTINAQLAAKVKGLPVARAMTEAKAAKPFKGDLKLASSGRASTV